MHYENMNSHSVSLYHGIRIDVVGRINSGKLLLVYMQKTLAIAICHV